MAHRGHEARLGAVSGLCRQIGSVEVARHVFEGETGGPYRTQLATQEEDQPPDGRDQQQHQRAGLELKGEQRIAGFGAVGTHRRIGVDENALRLLHQRVQSNIDTAQSLDACASVLIDFIEDRLQRQDGGMDLGQNRTCILVPTELSVELSFFKDAHAGIEDVIALRGRLPHVRGFIAFNQGDMHDLMQFAHFAIQLVERPERVFTNAVLKRRISIDDQDENDGETQQQRSREHLQQGCGLADTANDFAALSRPGCHSLTSICLICQTEREKYFSLNRLGVESNG